MPGDARCRCCGISIAGTPREQIRRCPICDICDRRHGDELQLHCVELVRTGQITPWHAIGAMLIDDAHVCGMLMMAMQPGDRTLYIGVPVAPPRWRVVIGRALARDEVPEVDLVIKVVLGKHLPGRGTPERLAAIAADLRDALQIMDPSIESVDVTTERDMLDPEHLKILLTARTPALGTVVTGADVELPADIMSRPRGQA